MTPKSLSVLLVFTCLITFSCCSLLNGIGERKAAVYFMAVGTDFERAGDDLKVFDRDFNCGIEEMNRISETIEMSRQNIQVSLERAKKQQVHEGQKDLWDFHNSLMLYYSESSETMDRMEKILDYRAQILTVLNPVINPATTDYGRVPTEEEVKKALTEFKSSVDKSILLVEKITPPEHFTRSHNSLMNALREYSTAAYEFIHALQTKEPGKIDSASSKFQFVSNKFYDMVYEMAEEIDQQKYMGGSGISLQKKWDDLYRQSLALKEQYDVTY